MKLDDVDRDTIFAGGVIVNLLKILCNILILFTSTVVAVFLPWLSGATHKERGTVKKVGGHSKNIGYPHFQNPSGAPGSNALA